MSCNKPCEGCAFTPGAAANLEPANHLKGMLCLLGAIPFWCHDGQDYKSPDAHLKTNREAVQSGWSICAGWKREVGKLAKTGYYRADAEATKLFATFGLIQLQIFCDTKDEQEKQEAGQNLEWVVKELGEKRVRFEGGSND